LEGRINKDLSFYDLTIKNIAGEPMDLRALSGRRIMLVNVASECGYTPQYTQLQEMHVTFPEIDIIGMPCNDFGNQEPGEAKEIKEFCSINYGVQFRLTEKLKIVTDPHPLIQWLTKRELNGKMDAEIKWNFSKFILNEDGTLKYFFPSSVEPFDDRILKGLNINI